MIDRPLSASKRVRHRAEFHALRATMWLIRSLPPSAALAVGAGLGRVAFDVLRIRRRVALDNLASTLGAGWSAPRCRAVARRAYQNFGRALVEYVRLPMLTARELEGVLTFDGLAHLQAAQGEGRGVLLLSGHFGSWQLMGACLALRGYAVSYVVRPQHNPHVNRVQEHIATAVGVQLISGVRGVLRALHRNEIVIILADQHAARDALRVEFLGRTAATARGPVEIALRTGAPILPAFMIREVGTNQRLQLLPPLRVQPRGGDHEHDVVHYTREHVRVLSEFIGRYPDHWLWLHRRWKAELRRS